MVLKKGMEEIMNMQLTTKLLVLQKKGEKSKIIATTKRIGKYKIVTDIIQKKIKKIKRIKETIINNGNVWTKDGKRTTCERKHNTEYDKEKDSRNSSTKLCRMIQTKHDTPPQKKITATDAPT